MIPSGEFNPGFRFSMIDVVILICGIFGTTIAGQREWWQGLVVGFVVGHFFLFCNVFRISRRPELIWAASFVFLCVLTITTGIPGWTWTIIISLVLTLTLTRMEMKKPSYHGILWKQINPALRAWWEKQQLE